MMCTGWIRLVFHSWFKMSVRSMIFCRLVLNMLCTTRQKKKPSAVACCLNTAAEEGESYKQHSAVKLSGRQA